MHQQPAPSTFPSMPAPNMLGSRYAMMMMPGRIPDHVFGGTVFLASPTGPLPHTEQRFSLQRREARPSRFLPKERCSLVTHEEAKKNFYLEELKLFLVKGSVGRPHARTASSPQCPLPLSARPRMTTTRLMPETLSHLKKKLHYTIR